MMKKGFRWISAALTVILFHAVLIMPAAGDWQDVSAYIPDTIEKLDLPQTESEASSASGAVYQITDYKEGWDYDDPFLTGMYNWEVNLVWEDMVLGAGKDGKVMPKYVRKIIATYPEYYIRQIEAEYSSGGRRSLIRYTISYRFSEPGQYSFTYDGNTDEILEGFYTNGDVRLITGTGDHADTWYAYDIVKGEYVPSSRSGVRSPSEFKSLRRTER